MCAVVLLMNIFKFNPLKIMTRDGDWVDGKVVFLWCWGSAYVKALLWLFTDITKIQWFITNLENLVFPCLYPVQYYFIIWPIDWNIVFNFGDLFWSPYGLQYVITYSKVVIWRQTHRNINTLVNIIGATGQFPVACRNNISSRPWPFSAAWPHGQN